MFMPAMLGSGNYDGFCESYTVWLLEKVEGGFMVVLEDGRYVARTNMERWTSIRTANTMMGNNGSENLRASVVGMACSEGDNVVAVALTNANSRKRVLIEVYALDTFFSGNDPIARLTVETGRDVHSCLFRNREIFIAFTDSRSLLVLDRKTMRVVNYTTNTCRASRQIGYAEYAAGVNPLTARVARTPDTRIITAAGREIHAYSDGLELLGEIRMQHIVADVAPYGKHDLCVYVCLIEEIGPVIVCIDIGTRERLYNVEHACPHGALFRRLYAPPRICVDAERDIYMLLGNRPNGLVLIRDNHRELALALSWNSRVGAQSLVRQLDCLIIQMIMAMVREQRVIQPGPVGSGSAAGEAIPVAPAAAGDGAAAPGTPQPADEPIYIDDSSGDESPQNPAGAGARSADDSRGAPAVTMTRKSRSGQTLVDDCPICRDPFKDKERIVALGCTHVFCSECLARVVVDGEVRCPVCRDQDRDRFQALRFEDGETIESGLRRIDAAGGDGGRG